MPRCSCTLLPTKVFTFSSFPLLMIIVCLCFGRPTAALKMMRGSLPPAKPALRTPVPLSTTRGWRRAAAMPTAGTLERHAAVTGDVLVGRCLSAGGGTEEAARERGVDAARRRDEIKMREVGAPSSCPWRFLCFSWFSWSSAGLRASSGEREAPLSHRNATSASPFSFAAGAGGGPL